jgi:hypothetical protein
MITNDARCRREIKARIAMIKAGFNKKKTPFTRKLDLELRKKLVKSYIWNIALHGAETRTLSEIRSEIPRRFFNVVLEKDGEDKLDGPHKQ